MLISLSHFPQKVDGKIVDQAYKQVSSVEHKPSTWLRVALCRSAPLANQASCLFKQSLCSSPLLLPCGFFYCFKEGNGRFGKEQEKEEVKEENKDETGALEPQLLACPSGTVYPSGTLQ